MKFAKMSLCHLLCFLLTAKVLLWLQKQWLIMTKESVRPRTRHWIYPSNVAFIIKQCLFFKQASFSIHSSLVVWSACEVSRLRTCWPIISKKAHQIFAETSWKEDGAVICKCDRLQQPVLGDPEFRWCKVSFTVKVWDQNWMLVVGEPVQLHSIKLEMVNSTWTWIKHERSNGNILMELFMNAICTVAPKLHSHSAIKLNSAVF